MEKETKPRVGIGIMIFKNGKILMGKRKNAHGEGQYAFPGGNLEYMESYEDCVLREIAEECGVEVKNIRFQYLTNLKQFAPKHYVHIGLAADWKSGEPEALEPDKTEHWGWYDLGDLPQPMFIPCQLAVKAHQTGAVFWDAA